MLCPTDHQGIRKLKPGVHQCWRWVALFVAFGLIGAGCSEPSVTPDLTDTSTATFRSLADLTALKIIVKRLRGDDIRNVQEDEFIDIQVDDLIAVEEAGRGLLRFPDDLAVEIFRTTELQISDVKLDSLGLNLVRLRLAFGTAYIQLNENARARVRLDTDFASIRADGTEFLLCHAPKIVTCLVTLKGEVEVEAQGQVVTARAGEAVYIFPDQPPQPAICADPEEVNQWMDRKRSTGEIEPLGALVGSWPQEPCPTESPDISTTSRALPSTEAMVKIEGGLYEVGWTQPDEFHIASIEIAVDAFWIDQYEVSNAQYEEFLGTSGNPLPMNWPGGSFPQGQEDHPVKGITWDDAAAYCSWANSRLPTEVEWEVAARGSGPDPPLYPWGSDSGAGGKVDDLSRTDTYEVGSVLFNKSPLDVFDMAGNVWEWVGDPYNPLPGGSKVLRGGRHGFLVDMAYRQVAEPDNERFVPFAGFRCAADEVSGE